MEPLAVVKDFDPLEDGGAGWLPGGISTQARRMEIDGLTSDTTYTVQVRAIGGSTGQSDWSAPQSCMAT